MRNVIRGVSIWRSCLAGVVAIMLLHPIAAPAQDAAPDNARDLPRLELTDAQKQTILISVINQNFKNEAPPNFQPVVGAIVPPNIDLLEMPTTIVGLAPEVAPFRLVRVINQVIIVDPQTRRVVEVIVKKP